MKNLTNQQIDEENEYALGWLQGGIFFLTIIPAAWVAFILAVMTVGSMAIFFVLFFTLLYLTAYWFFLGWSVKVVVRWMVRNQ